MWTVNGKDLARQPTPENLRAILAVEKQFLFVEISVYFVEISVLFVELDGIFVELDGIFVDLDGIFVDLDGMFVDVELNKKNCRTQRICRRPDLAIIVVESSMIFSLGQATLNLNKQGQPITT